MATDGTTFEIDIPVTGGDAATSAADAVRILSDRLEQSEAAAIAAAGAVKEAESAYKASEIAADRAAKAHEKISLAVDTQAAKVAAVVAEHGMFSSAAQKASDKLAQLTARQSEAAAKAEVTKLALVTQAEALDRVTKASADAASAQSAVAKAMKDAGAAQVAQEKAAKATAAAIKEQNDIMAKGLVARMQKEVAAAAAEEKVAKDAAKKSAAHLAEIDAAAKGTGNLGKLSGALGQLGGPLGTIGNKATGAADAIADLSETVGAAGPYIAAAIAIVALATAMVSATVAATAWAISMAGAARSQMLLSDGIAQSVDGGRHLDDTIRSLEKKVPQTSEELRSMAANLAKTGLRGRELADALEESAVKAAKVKWGPDFAKGVNTTDKIVARLKANVSDMFAGPRIQGALDTFLTKLSALADLFDENTVTGRAMRVVVEDIFGNLIDGASSIIPKVIAGFIQLQIWILKALIFIKPYGSEIMFVVQALAVFAAVIVGVVVGAIALGTAVLVAFIALPQLLGEAFTWAGTKLTEFGTSVVSFFSSLDLSSLGSALIDGLIGGIMGAGPNVINAITGIADGAIGAAKKALGIASPSKVFEDIGTNTSEGMAIGVDDGAEGVQQSMVSMISPPDAQPAAEPATSSGGGGTYHITIQAAPGSTVDAYMQLIRETLTDLVEGDVTQLAGAVPAR